MPRDKPASLRRALSGADLPGRRILDARESVALSDVARGWSLGIDRRDISGRSAVIVTDGQLSAALALIDLDGLARRIVVLPPDLPPEHLPAIIADAEVDTIVSDRGPERFAGLGVPLFVRCGLPIGTAESVDAGECATEWVLLTSGTTGVPKMVVHSLAALAAAIAPATPRERPIVWATFYDIRRYGGLQIFLRAILGARSLVLSKAGEPIVDHLNRLAASGVTHISGTPSHWRRTLMCATAGVISPEYVRLSGEIADQAILNSLHEALSERGDRSRLDFPRACSRRAGAALR